MVPLESQEFEDSSSATYFTRSQASMELSGTFYLLDLRTPPFVLARLPDLDRRLVVQTKMTYSDRERAFHYDAQSCWIMG